MYELQPEIYRLIVKAVVDSGRIHDDGDSIRYSDAKTTTRQETQQATLATLMRTSKVSPTPGKEAEVQADKQTLYDLSSTELYRDCLVADFDTFVQDLTTNPGKAKLLSHVKTLRVYQGDHALLKEPNYHHLISQGG
jgi:hypothetical protein